MAQNGDEDRSTDDLSEEASPYKLEEFRRKGHVAQSRELSGILALMAAGAALYAFSPLIGTELTDYMKEMFRTDAATKLDLSDSFILFGVLSRVLKLIAYVVSPVALAGLILGVLGSFSQIGAVFSTEPLSPDLNKINPLKGLKQLFSMKKFYDGLRLIARGSIVALVAYLIIRGYVNDSPRYIVSEPESLLGAFASVSRIVFMALCAILVVFAAFDFWLQKWDYGKEARLTKKEAKEEHKEHEGDPMIKARIRSIQRQMAQKRMMAAVKSADVIVTNPTHFAVALKYDREKMDAPKVVAKGIDFLAQKIKKIAADAGVPVLENPPLARTLYKTVKEGQSVPRALYQAVAEVLAYVYKLKNKRFL